MTGAADNAWPDLALLQWDDTRGTLHMFLQVVGKVRLALTPLINHWWNVPFYVSARGLTTSLMHAGTRGLDIEFDFLDDVARVAHDRRPVAPGSARALSRSPASTCPR